MMVIPHAAPLNLNVMCFESYLVMIINTSKNYADDDYDGEDFNCDDGWQETLAVGNDDAQNQPDDHPDVGKEDCKEYTDDDGGCIDAQNMPQPLGQKLINYSFDC